MTINFIKMNGCGNDYIYLDFIKNPTYSGLIGKENKKDESLFYSFLSQKLSDRNFSIGGDGLVTIEKSDVADCKMRIFNKDGSEGAMCGNAIRCVGKYIYENSISKKCEIMVETKSGIKKLKLRLASGQVKSVTVDMGAPAFDFVSIGIDATLLNSKNTDSLISYPIKFEEIEYKITCVSMGNPHTVIFMPEIDHLNLEELGPKFEKNPLFKNGTNTEFVKVINKNTVQMRVWERGSGETLACGTGACASVVAAVLNNLISQNEETTVLLKGGSLLILYNSTVYMTGPAEINFMGCVEI